MVDPFEWMDDGISTKNGAVQWVFSVLERKLNEIDHYYNGK